MINGVVYKNKDYGYTLLSLYTEKLHPVSIKEEAKYESQLTASSVALVEFKEPFSGVFTTTPVVVVLLTDSKDKTIEVSAVSKEFIIVAAYKAAMQYVEHATMV